MKKVGGALLAVVLAVVLASVLLAPSEGTGKQLHYPQLARSYGNGGYVGLPTVLPGSSNETRLQHLAADPDGAVYMTGLSAVAGCDRESEICRSPGYLARANPDGSIAAAYGDSGRVEVGEALEQMSPPLADPDGRALIASQEGSDVTVHRFLADGSLDTSFGSGGTTTFDCSCSSTGFEQLTLGIDHQQRIVVSIFAGNETLARLLPSGAIDDGFGGGVVQMGTESLPQPPMGIAFGRDDEIYTWTADCCQPESLFYLHRVSSSGRIDSTFDARADKALIDIATRGIERGVLGYSTMALVVRPNGLLDLFGAGWLIRMQSDGSASRRFASGGYRRLRWAVLSPTLVSDGKVLAIGTVPDKVDLIRLRQDGGADHSFGTGGALPIEGVKLEGYAAENGLTLARLRDGRAQVLDISDLTCTVSCSARPDPKLIRYRVGPAD